MSTDPTEPRVITETRTADIDGMSVDDACATLRQAAEGLDVAIIDIDTDSWDPVRVMGKRLETADEVEKRIELAELTRQRDLDYARSLLRKHGIADPYSR